MAAMCALKAREREREREPMSNPSTPGSLPTVGATANPPTPGGGTAAPPATGAPLKSPAPGGGTPPLPRPGSMANPPTPGGGTAPFSTTGAMANPPTQLARTMANSQTPGGGASSVSTTTAVVNPSQAGGEGSALIRSYGNQLRPLVLAMLKYVQIFAYAVRSALPSMEVVMRFLKGRAQDLCKLVNSILQRINSYVVKLLKSPA
ncbi:hypothetical protein KP509_25G049400 [Ceratopteris richardii]|uniref:Uncharacterized protein n=1 Tax=Ceratopteris richardii TaxID=49495 RepID=A0A8T2RQZ1_CERRI|nr:hypothetical protein KP509_25G049400 [Ceratopteris richardii]